MQDHITLVPILLISSPEYRRLFCVLLASATSSESSLILFGRATAAAERREYILLYSWGLQTNTC